jgi:hypothetical protein
MNINLTYWQIINILKALETKKLDLIKRYDLNDTTKQNDDLEYTANQSLIDLFETLLKNTSLLSKDALKGFKVKPYSEVSKVMDELSRKTLLEIEKFENLDF